MVWLWLQVTNGQSTCKLWALLANILQLVITTAIDRMVYSTLVLQNFHSFGDIVDLRILKDKAVDNLSDQFEWE